MACKSVKGFKVAEEIMFEKLSRMLRDPVHYICVVDGVNRPASKRGHAVTSQPVALHLRLVIEAMGFVFWIVSTSLIHILIH